MLNQSTAQDQWLGLVVCQKLQPLSKTKSVTEIQEMLLVDYLCTRKKDKTTENMHENQSGHLRHFR